MKALDAYVTAEKAAAIAKTEQEKNAKTTFDLVIKKIENACMQGHFKIQYHGRIEPQAVGWLRELGYSIYTEPRSIIDMAIPALGAVADPVNNISWDHKKQ